MPKHHILAYSPCIENVTYIEDHHLVKEYFVTIFVGWHHLLWEGKKIAIIATHGYDAEYGAGPFEAGIKRLCEHSNLEYMGMYSARDEDNLASFQTEDVMNGARIFARTLLTK